MQSRIHPHRPGVGPKFIGFLGRSAFAVGAMFGSGIAVAANLSEAQARYQEERAICMSGESHQDRATCLREAGAALAESKGGKLGGETGTYEHHQLMRCDVHLAGDRDDCLRRMRGEGTISGSVEGGGIYRELRTTVPAQ